MDLFTLAWITLMSLSGLFLGLTGLIKGNITLNARAQQKVALYRRPDLRFYFLCVGFLISGLALISASLYLYV